ncbi:MAG: UDP-N-acetylglucosamine 2-epimerase (non-hydrolyzing) [Planctomycetaceae bacterium]
MSELPVSDESPPSLRRWILMLAAPVLLHLVVVAPNEPVFNGDANRHAMTSVFFRDLLTDMPLDHLRQYAEDYYRQYPALGLLIWPPLFHGVVGVLMLVFGTSVWVPRLFVFFCFTVAAVCLYRVCRRRMSSMQSELTVVTFSLLPMIFVYSRHIMLEMPTLALCMVSIERFDAWLSQQRVRNLYFAAIAASLAALTRFDAVVLLPTLLAMACFEGRWKRLFTPHILSAAATAIILLAPTYYVIWKEMGDLHVRQAAESVSGTTSQMFRSGALTFYPGKIHEQTGWPVVVFLALGLIAAFRKEHRSAAGVFYAILVGTYLTFTPLAELKPRHTIYWLPAIAWFASVGAIELSAGLQKLTRRPHLPCQTATMSALICATTWVTFNFHVFRVTGYERAARVVLANTDSGDSIFVDGWWDGNMTYQIRHLDATRSRHIVRADQVLYDFMNVPSVDFRQFVESDLEILKVIADAAPKCILFEDPQPFGRIPVSEHMRSLIKSMPFEFPELDDIPVNCTVPGAQPFSLRIFKVDLPRLQEHIQRAASGSPLRSTQIPPASQPPPPDFSASAVPAPPRVGNRVSGPGRFQGNTMTKRPLKLMCVFGTRPEAIKVAPVILAGRQRSDIDVVACSTGQHREMLDQVTSHFGICPDVELQLMQPGQTLTELTSRCLTALDGAINSHRPDCLLGQGDTTSAMCAGMVAFYHRLPFIHVEAGLRTDTIHSPFPEELNRRICSLVTALHCAPTEAAAANLRKEGYAASDIVVTGNTVIDALQWTVEKERAEGQRWLKKHPTLSHGRMVLITAHRRENHGDGIRSLCLAVKTLAERFSDVTFVYPVHLNPNIRQPVHELLGQLANVQLIAPAEYPEFVWLMDRATIILSDSGGVQEEAPSLRKPVLVTRESTERPEALAAGATRLVGTETASVVEAVSTLLTDRSAYEAMQVDSNPYGNGQAAQRILTLIAERFCAAARS